MLEAYGDIWKHAKDYDAVVITTNGFVKRNGEAVMGRGVARDANYMFPGLALWLGQLLDHWGNRPFIFYDAKWKFEPYIITLPVKPKRGPNGEPGWLSRADTELIESSTKEMVNYIDQSFKNTIKTILMPRPGCGNGGLEWNTVKPIIGPLLDDRFTVMEKEPQKF